MSDARGGWDEGDDARKSAMLTMSAFMAFILLDVAAIAFQRFESAANTCLFICTTSVSCKPDDDGGVALQHWVVHTVAAVHNDGIEACV